MNLFIGLLYVIGVYALGYDLGEKQVYSEKRVCKIEGEQMKETCYKLDKIKTQK